MEFGMARIPEAELERLKAEVSLVRLIEDAGIWLPTCGTSECHNSGTTQKISSDINRL